MGRRADEDIHPGCHISGQPDDRLGARAGVILGSGIGGIQFQEEQMWRVLRGQPRDCVTTSYHYRKRKDGRNTRVFVGSYHFRLRRGETPDWLITAMRFDLKFLDGNAALEAAEAG